MSDLPKPNPSLSEISHLFLSSVRERQTGGAPRPTRVPPGQKPAFTSPASMLSSIPSSGPSSVLSSDVVLTPEEFAHVSKELSINDTDTQVAPVSAVITGQLNGSMLDRARQYAAHLSTHAGRVGLIFLDMCEFRVLLFEHHPNADAMSAAEPMTQGFDARRMSEALEELAWDVDRWLVLMPNLRSPEAHAMLKQIPHWVLLSTCNHDGVVAGYRTLKGLAEISTPTVSLSLLDAPSEAEAQKAYRKLNGVAGQFLNWPLDWEAAVANVDHVAEHLVIGFCGSHDKAQLANAPQWEIVSKFIERARPIETQMVESSPVVEAIASNVATNIAPNLPQPPRHVADILLNESAKPAQNFPKVEPAESIPMPIAPAMRMNTADPEVYDLPNGDSSAMGITGAIIASRSNDLVECPVKPPMCPDARLAVGRDRRMVMVAVARHGLSDLRAIGQAYQWTVQNRPLLCMALPQMAIDAHQLPQLELIIDHNDMSADILQPMLQSGNVTVRTYRKLRWGEKTGLLLDAA